MVNTHYRKGYVFELKIKHSLESKGFYVVKSAGSHGLFDLIAFDKSISLGLQLKNNCKVSKKEKDELYGIDVPTNFYCLSLIKKGIQLEVEFFGKQPDKELKQKIITTLTNRRSTDINDFNF